MPVPHLALTARGLLLLVAAVVSVALAARSQLALPDLVLPVVVAGALRSGASRGALLGLAGGWLVDLMPPGSSVLGTAALLYAGAGLLAGAGRREGETPFGWVAVVGAACAVLVTAGRLVVAALSGAAVEWPVVGARLGLTVALCAVLVPLSGQLRAAACPGTTMMGRGVAMRPSRVVRDHSPRVWVLALVVLCFMGALLGRLGQVQIVGHADYQRAAATLNTRTVTEAAVRGRILDRNGVPLVDNTTETAVTVDRAMLVESKDGGRDLVRRVAGVLGAPFDLLWGRTQLCGVKDAPPAPVCWAGSAYVPIPLISGADPRKALSLLERPDLYPGVGVSAQPVRDYPAERTVNAAHLLGYLGRSKLRGRGGVARARSATSTWSVGPVWSGSTTPGCAAPRRRARSPSTRGASSPAPSGRPTRCPARTSSPTSTPGCSRSAETALASAVATPTRSGYKADSAAAVVLDVTNGGVVAAASYPTYDPRRLDRRGDPGRVRAADRRGGGDAAGVAGDLGGLLPGLDLQGRQPSCGGPMRGTRSTGTYNCTSSYTIGNRKFANFESRAYGPISLRKAVEVSCDTIFYDFAYRSWLAQGGLDGEVGRQGSLRRDGGRVRAGSHHGHRPARGAGGADPRPGSGSRSSGSRPGLETCKRAKSGYPELAATDPSRAAYLKELAVENCRTGFQFRAGDAANFAIGQGDITVTPLQMAQVYAAIANGGTLWRPEVARGFVAPDGAVHPVAAVKAGTVSSPRGVLLPARRPAGGGDRRFRARRVRRVPVEGVAHCGQDGHSRGVRCPGHRLVRVLRPGHQPGMPWPSSSPTVRPVVPRRRPPHARSTRSCAP